MFINVALFEQVWNGCRLLRRISLETENSYRVACLPSLTIEGK